MIEICWLFQISALCQDKVKMRITKKKYIGLLQLMSKHLSNVNHKEF